jgi:hypothetical protein
VGVRPFCYSSKLTRRAKIVQIAQVEPRLPCIFRVVIDNNLAPYLFPLSDWCQTITKRDKISNEREMVFHDMNQSQARPKRAQNEQVFCVRFVLFEPSFCKVEVF